MNTNVAKGRFFSSAGVRALGKTFLKPAVIKKTLEMKMLVLKLFLTHDNYLTVQ